MRVQIALLHVANRRWVRSSARKAGANAKASVRLCATDTIYARVVGDDLVRGQRMMALVLRKAFAAWSKVATTHAYQPEKHYMRGPGPKTLGMIGRRFRAETNKEIAEALPERWLTLMRALDDQEQR
jgi:hypothetical protein